MPPSRTPPPQPGDDDRNFIVALARGLDVLSCFRSGEKLLGNQDIARRCGLPRSTVSRLTHTLTTLGYLIHVPEEGKYRLGTATLALGSAMLSRLDVRQIARPLMQKLAATTDAEVGAETLRRLCERYKDVVRRETGKAFPQDPMVQLKGAIEAVFRSWNGARAIAYRVRERISHDLGTAVNVQSMVFGNRDDDAGTGVGFTRDPATGAQGAYGDFLVNA